MAGDPFQPGLLQDAVHHLFNGDLRLSQSMLSEHVAAQPLDPLGYSLSAAAPFYNFIGQRFRVDHGNSLQSMISADKIAMPQAMEKDLAGLLQRARQLAAKSRD